MFLQKVVSGGQTGVDRAALDAARATDVPIGGWCPQGRRAEDGEIPDRYPLTETPSDVYAQRTAWNVRDSDGTLIIIASRLEGGTALTKREAEKRGRPALLVRRDEPDAVARIRAWIEEHEICVLNVAGPRESEEPGIYEAARTLLEGLFDEPSGSGRDD